MTEAGVFSAFLFVFRLSFKMKILIIHFQKPEKLSHSQIVIGCKIDE